MLEAKKETRVSPEAWFIGDLLGVHNPERLLLDESRADLRGYAVRMTLKYGIRRDSQREVVELLYGLSGEAPKTKVEVGRALGKSPEAIERIRRLVIKKIGRDERFSEGLGLFTGEAFNINPTYQEVVDWYPLGEGKHIPWQFWN